MPQEIEILNAITGETFQMNPTQEQLEFLYLCESIGKNKTVQKIG